MVGFLFRNVVIAAKKQTVAWQGSIVTMPYCGTEMFERRVAEVESAVEYGNFHAFALGSEPFWGEGRLELFLPIELSHFF